jgi:hypothetical protein
MDDHAFTARTEAVDSTPAVSFFDGCSVAPLLGPFRTRKAGATCLACAVFRKSWKSRSFERLVHNIIRGCVDEGGILIDLRGGDLIESDRSTDVAALVDLKQWHVGSPL